MNNFEPRQTDFVGLSPYDSLGNSAKKYALELAEELGTSKQLVACILLSMFAAAQVGVSCLANFVVRLSSYMAYGAPPSTGKSPAIKRTLSVLDALISKYILISKEEVQKREALISGLEKKIKLIEKKIAKSSNFQKQGEYADEISSIKTRIEILSIPITLMMGSMSIQSFVKELSLRGGRGIQISPEGGILASLNTVSATQLTPILQAWSNESISETTKSGHIHVEDSSFVMLAMWQSEPLCKIIRDSKYRDIGLSVRCLIQIEPELLPRVGSGNLSIESEDWYARQLEMAFVRILPQTGVDVKKFMYRLSDSARSVLDDFKKFIILDPNHRNAVSKNGDIAGKIDIHAVRLAMMLQPMECNDVNNCEIDFFVMHRACCLSMFFANHHINILDNSYKEDMLKLSMPLIDAIAKKQLQNCGSWFGTEEAKRIIGFSNSKLDKILFWMKDNGWIKQRVKNNNKFFGDVTEAEEWVILIDFNTLL